MSIRRKYWYIFALLMFIVFLTTAISLKEDTIKGICSMASVLIFAAWYSSLPIIGRH